MRFVKLETRGRKMNENGYELRGLNGEIDQIEKLRDETNFQHWKFLSDDFVQIYERVRYYYRE